MDFELFDDECLVPEPVPDTARRHAAHVVAEFAAAGFPAAMALNEDGTVHCYSCHRDADLRAAHVEEIRLLPSLAGAGLRCPTCNAAGVLLVDRGPAAAREEQRAWRVVRSHSARLRRAGRATLAPVRTIAAALRPASPAPG